MMYCVFVSFLLIFIPRIPDDTAHTKILINFQSKCYPKQSKVKQNTSYNFKCMHHETLNLDRLCRLFTQLPQCFSSNIIYSI